MRQVLRSQRYRSSVNVLKKCHFPPTPRSTKRARVHVPEPEDLEPDYVAETPAIWMGYMDAIERFAWSLMGRAAIGSEETLILHDGISPGIGEGSIQGMAQMLGVADGLCRYEEAYSGDTETHTIYVDTMEATNLLFTMHGMRAKRSWPCNGFEVVRLAKKLGDVRFMQAGCVIEMRMSRTDPWFSPTQNRILKVVMANGRITLGGTMITPDLGTHLTRTGAQWVHMVAYVKSVLLLRWPADHQAWLSPRFLVWAGLVTIAPPTMA